MWAWCSQGDEQCWFSIKCSAFCSGQNIQFWSLQIREPFTTCLLKNSRIWIKELFVLILFLHNHRAKILFLLRFLADYIPGVGLVARKWAIFLYCARLKIWCTLCTLPWHNYVCFLSAQVHWWNTYPSGRRSTFITGVETEHAEKVIQVWTYRGLVVTSAAKPRGDRRAYMWTSCDNLSCKWSRSSVTWHIISGFLASMIELGLFS